MGREKIVRMSSGDKGRILRWGVVAEKDAGGGCGVGQRERGACLGIGKTKRWEKGGGRGVLL